MNNTVVAVLIILVLIVVLLELVGFDVNVR